MAKQTPAQFDVQCPCCHASLKVDPELRAVISHKAAEKPRHAMFEEDLSSSVSRLKGEAARREEIFQKSVVDNKNQQELLSRKFDELLKQAKSDPDSPPPKRDIDFD